MVLEERKCPNCGSSELIEKDGTYVCMNCRTFFDNPNDLKITTRDETKIEQIRSKERMKKDEHKFNIKFVLAWFGAMIALLIIAKLFNIQ